MAGSPCPVEVMSKVQSRMHMREVTICYGMTETSPVSTQSALDDPLEKRVGHRRSRPSARRGQDRRPETGRCVPARRLPVSSARAGTASCSDTGTTPQATAEAIDAARWMHTGDLATMDDDGYVNIVGRIKDMIIRGGENIYPREIEEFLYRPSRCQRRAGDRRAVRALRRGGHGLGQAEGGCGPHRRDTRRLLPQSDRRATRSRDTGSSSTRFR